MGAVAQGVAAVQMASAQAAHSQEPVAPLGERIEDINELDLEQLLAAPMVESASRRRQSLEEAPGAITVIEGADLATAGPLTLAEALRTVPGAWVFQSDANSFHLGLRGSDDSANAAMLILVNGRRFFDLTAHGAPWQVLGINVKEIERIEILRGPGATLYGADAFNGVINILTKRPTDHPGRRAPSWWEATSCLAIQPGWPTA
jgi:iron complex outermembrane receptor protein